MVIDGYLSYNREVELFHNDMKKDAHLLGLTMKDLVYDVWHVSGQKRAMELIEKANKDIFPIKIRWVWLSAPNGPPDKPFISSEKIDPKISGEDVLNKESTKKGNGYLYTYIPIQIDNQRHGALEISEPLSELKDYTHESIVRAIILAGVMAAISGIILLLLGIKMIGRPLDQLMMKTKRIGTGDFTGDLMIRGRDELSRLAEEINQMCQQLYAAHEAVRKEAEARIAILEQLRHSERLASIGRLASGIAHELGTPLNIVSGRAKIIANENLGKKEINEFSRIIQAQVERMTQIIRQLLDFSRHRAPKKSYIDFHNLVNQVLEMINPIARKQRVTFNLVKNRDLPEVSIDITQMQQVLMNLVMNGIQAMPDGGQLKIELHRECPRSLSKERGQEKEYLTIYVRDEGNGISEEDITHIFEPFFTTKDIGKGTGLGLSIVFGIIQEHSGWIDVQSKIGQGTCFTFYLPLETTDEK